MAIVAAIAVPVVRTKEGTGKVVWVRNRVREKSGRRSPAYHTALQPKRLQFPPFLIPRRWANSTYMNSRALRARIEGDIRHTAAIDRDSSSCTFCQ